MSNFSLDSVIDTGDKFYPLSILVHSVHGLGKTLFGSTFERPILLRTEDGTGAISVPSFPDIVSSFQDVENAISALHEKHNYKTLVVDTIDWLEPIVWKKQIEMKPFSENGKEITHLEDYGYGSGYKMVLDWWRYLIGGLDSLRLNRGMNIVLLAHSDVQRYDSPETDPYERYVVKMHKAASNLWQEWAEIVLFCNYKTRIHSADVGFNKEVKRGEGSGERVIYTEERPAFLAKNRWSLPPEIYIGNDKTWSAFHKELNKCTGGKYAIPEISTKKKEAVK